MENMKSKPDSMNKWSLVTLLIAGLFFTGNAIAQISVIAPAKVNASGPKLSSPQSFTIHWVDASGEGDFTDIQSAVDAAQNGDEIRVVQGIYTTPAGDIVVWNSKDLKIHGGYCAVEGQRDIEACPTVIDGQNVEGRRCVYAYGLPETSEFSGFTIRGGNINYIGGGIYVYGNSHLTVKNCTFSSNRGQSGGGLGIQIGNAVTLVNCIFENNIADLQGGGIRNFASTLTLMNCVFLGNQANYIYAGGAIMNSNGGVLNIDECKFIDNTAPLPDMPGHLGGQGGAIMNYRSTLYLTRSTFIGNNATYGGAVSTLESSMPPPVGADVTITNSLFIVNSSRKGGAIYNQRSTLNVTNCTLSRNITSDTGALHVESLTTATISNSIFWNNNGGEVTTIPPLLLEITYSNIEGGFEGEGNIDQDPLFVDPENGDFHLLPDSPSVDTGTSEGAPSEDIEGMPRPQGYGFDMGAYETASIPPEPDWEAGFGGDNQDVFHDVKETSDGGFIMVGYTESFDEGAGDYGNGERDIWLVKTNAQGETCDYSASGECDGDGVFVKRFWRYPNREEAGYSVVEAEDGGFVLVGLTYFNGPSDLWLIKTDADGNTCDYGTSGNCNGTGVFALRITGSPVDANDAGTSIARTLDGGYIVTGYTVISGSEGAGVWLIKLDGGGNIQWRKTIHRSDGGQEYGAVVRQTSDGGYIILANAVTFEGNLSWLIKTNAQGETCDTANGGDCDGTGVFARSLGRYGAASTIGEVIQTTDGSYIVGTLTNEFGAGAGDNDAWLLKLDAEGNTCDYSAGGSCDGDGVFSRVFSGSPYWDDAASVSETMDGGFALAGWWKQSAGWLIKTDSSGNTCTFNAEGACFESPVKFAKTFGAASGSERFYAMQQTSDGSYIMAGRDMTGNNNAWLVHHNPAE